MFDARLRQLAGAEAQSRPSIQEAETMSGAILDAILVDLTAEQASILRSGWKPLLFGTTIADGLGKLLFLAEHSFPLTANDARRPQARLAARLVAGVEFLARTRRRWYEHWLFPWSPWRRGPALRKQMLNSAAKLCRNLFGDENRKATRDLIREEYSQFHGGMTLLAKRPAARAAASEVFFVSLLKHRISTDIQEPLPRVFHHAEWQALRRAETQQYSLRARRVS